LWPVSAIYLGGVLAISDSSLATKSTSSCTDECLIPRRFAISVCEQFSKWRGTNTCRKIALLVNESLAQCSSPTAGTGGVEAEFEIPRGTLVRVGAPLPDRPAADDADVVDEPELELLPEEGLEGEAAARVETLRLSPGGLEHPAEHVVELGPRDLDTPPTQFGYEHRLDERFDVVDVAERPFLAEHRRIA
jgi:hypothetical protein